ncbi:MAG: 3-methyl-2-oxobutanoate dehydrogenase subunit beta [Clostridiales bacterium]|nr:3-methyl-2-oxobutanoate dehydrogenase subunit beta [Clostridiales bacterium]
MADRVVMKGNEALAEAALRAGCRFFSGYPITPQTEVLEYLSWRMDEVGGTLIQTEDELTGLHMLTGAALAGARVLSTSAGPGFALFHEGLSYLAGCDIPSVLVDVQRVGSACGDISVSQGDYEEVVHGGGNGDSQYLVLTPASVQEQVDMVIEAYDLAEQYKTPVVILSDAIIGQMMEGVTLPDMKEHDIDAPTSERIMKEMGDDLNGTISFGGPLSDYNTYSEVFTKKWAAIKEAEQKWENIEVADCDVCCVSYGISSRVCKEAVKKARAKGVKLGLVRLKTAWPFPEKAFAEVNPDVKGFLSVEMSIKGQVVPDIRLATNCNYPVFGYFSVKDVPDSDKVVEIAESIIAGTAKEVK